jgi:hypothetical protein
MLTQMYEVSKRQTELLKFKIEIEQMKEQENME